jgi:hypothetical protein
MYTEVPLYLFLIFKDLFSVLLFYSSLYFLFFIISVFKNACLNSVNIFKIIYGGKYKF